MKKNKQPIIKCCIFCNKKFYLYPRPGKKLGKNRKYCGTVCQYAHRHQLAIAKINNRFWAAVEKRDNGCWLWTGYIDNEGYGIFCAVGGRKTKFLAHRYAYKLYHPNDNIDDVMILHSCDIPNCVSPYHLRKGTQFDNMRDASIRGRKATKLTVQNVLDIRNEYATGTTTHAKLGQKYGIHANTVGEIIKKQIWKYV